MGRNPRRIKVERARDWQQAKRIFERYSLGWVFRGQGNAQWKLQTSLERALTGWKDKLFKVMESDIDQLAASFDALFEVSFATKEFKENLLEAGPSLYDSRLFNPIKEMERESLRLFESRLHHYLPHNSLPRDLLEWLALMQHHGTPTRLLDFTSSPYIAAFFALENPAESCAVWGMDVGWFQQYGDYLVQTSLAAERESGGGTSFQRTLEYIVSKDVPGVFAMIPRHLNERLVTQQGLFFALGDTTKDFTENLLSIGDEVRDHLIKIEIPGEFSAEALSDLNRMNINRATLFPGIDGFAQSIKAHVLREFDENLNRRRLRSALTNPHQMARLLEIFSHMLTTSDEGLEDLIKTFMRVEKIDPEKQGQLMQRFAENGLAKEVMSALQVAKNKTSSQ